MALSINKNWLLLAGAIALGGVAFFLSNKAIQSRIAQLEEEATRGKTMQRVVVANKLLRAGEMVDSTVVSVREMPADFVNKATVLPETYDTVDGQVLQVDVQRGEPLLTNYTVNRGGAVFAAAVKEGRRALTIEVDEISSISGMLRPGDRIDLMLTAKPSQGGMPTANAKDMTFPMLSNVEVLATGQAQKARPAAGEGAAQGYSHITLDVTPEEGTRIIAAKTAGRLTAVLRNPADKTANNSRGHRRYRRQQRRPTPIGRIHHRRNLWCKQQGHHCAGARSGTQKFQQERNSERHSSRRGPRGRCPSKPQ